jgi:endonuclease YncB( thermonuclease family)
MEREADVNKTGTVLIGSAIAAVVLGPALSQERMRFPQMSVCGASPRVTGVVDGDTVWVDGTKYRFEEIDTPEKGSLAECPQEALQAAEATDRLAEILSEHGFTIKPSGEDRYGRTLARFMIGEKSAGEMLIEEGLARRWRGKTEEWCR